MLGIEGKVWRAGQQQGKGQPHPLVQAGTPWVREDPGREELLLPSQQQRSLNWGTPPWCEDAACRDWERCNGAVEEEVTRKIWRESGSRPTFKPSRGRRERVISYRPWGRQSLSSPRSHWRLLGWDPVGRNGPNTWGPGQICLQPLYFMVLVHHTCKTQVSST